MSSMPRFVRQSHVVVRRVAGETVLIPVGAPSVSSGGAGRRTADFFLLNDTAEVVWEGLAQARSLDELVRILTKEFDIDPAIAKADVESFLASLQSIEAVSRVEG